MSALYAGCTADFTIRLIQCDQLLWKIALKPGEHECISEKIKSSFLDFYVLKIGIKSEGSIFEGF